MKPNTLQHLAHLMHSIQMTSADQQSITGVSVDSRLTARGDLFFALPGAQVDGHNFLSEVASKGAVAAVVKSDYVGPAHGMALVHSENVLASLQLLAHNFIKQSHTKIVAVTGSVGKTTTKEFITTLLQSKYNVSASPGNSNSQIGLPLALLNHSTLEENFIVLEMGMSLPGQIAKLVEIAPPSVAIVTSVALVHACNFDSIEDIALAKAELFSHPDTKLGIYPKECDFGIFSCTGASRKLSFSTTLSTADYFLETRQNKMTLFTHSGWLSQFPQLNLPGLHNRHNFLAAAVAARHLGMSWEEIRFAQASLILPERRMQIVEKDGVIFANDSYNASEISTKSALSSLPDPTGSGKKIAVIGEMLELGKFSKQCHLAVGEHALNCVDRMLCLGQDCAPIVECWQQAGRPVFWSKDRNLLVDALRVQLSPGDVVLLKGSRANGLWKVLEEI